MQTGTMLPDQTPAWRNCPPSKVKTLSCIRSSETEEVRLRFSGRPIYFDAHQARETEPWTHYTTSGFDNLPQPDARTRPSHDCLKHALSSLILTPLILVHKHPRQSCLLDTILTLFSQPAAAAAAAATAAAVPSVRPASGCVLRARNFQSMFCSSARLSGALQELGFQTLAVDHFNKSTHPVQTLD